MLPGLIRSPWIPASSAAIAYFHWKWMSATTGTVDLAAIASRAFASSQCGTATRTRSTPAATSEAICCSVALTSEVFVVVIDWTDTRAPPPEVLERPVLPFVDQEGAGRVGAEGQGDPVGHAGVLDRSTEVVGEVEERVALGRTDRHRRRRGP